MSPTTGAAVALAVCGLLSLVLPPAAAVSAALAVVSATVVDAAFARRRPALTRQVGTVLSRGVPAPLEVHAEAAGARRVVVRQPLVPELALEPWQAEGHLDATLIPRRRGRHTLPSPAVRTVGPLGLARWDHDGGGRAEVLVYPDLPAARQLAMAVRSGRFGEPGRLTRGPLGLGTDFESIRDYSPDDDVRQVNWLATARLGRPMSNQYRVEQDREVMCVLDAGRLMGAPLGADLTRLDAALDAVTAVAMVADEVGDRCGAVVFDAVVRRHLAPRRSGGAGVVQALFDVEPTAVDSDYELAFRTVGGTKRALVLVLTDLVDESAARPLVDAVPVLARRHAVVVASVSDPDLTAAVSEPPTQPVDVYAAAVASELLEARIRVGHLLEGAGASVVEAEPPRLAAACVSVYLEMKARARL